MVDPTSLVELLSKGTGNHFLTEISIYYNQKLFFNAFYFNLQSENRTKHMQLKLRDMLLLSWLAC